MLKKSKSCFLNIMKSFDKKYKSCNDLVNLCNPSLCIMKIIKTPKKLVSYGEFLTANPNATKKQRVHAITNFYKNLLG